jgi:hypothetical protein
MLIFGKQHLRGCLLHTPRITRAAAASIAGNTSAALGCACPRFGTQDPASADPRRRDQSVRSCGLKPLLRCCGRVLAPDSRNRWTMRWRPVIDAFAITFGDPRPGAETY